MNSSKVIKSYRPGGGNAILISRPGGVDSEEGAFHSLSSLWQSDDAEFVAVLTQLEREKERLRAETETIKAESEAKVAAAKARVEQIEKEAHDKGFAAGKEESAVLEEERLARIDALLAAIEGDRQRLYGQYEADMLTLVKTMVDRVLFHEVTINPQVIEVCLKTALSYVVENSNITIRLHGEDLERLRQAAMERPELLAGHKKIELVEDPAIGLGGCALDTGFGEIDATLDSRRAKVFAAIDAVLRKAVKELQ